MSESNSYGEKPTSLGGDTNRNCSEFEEQSSHHGNCNEKNAEQVTKPINLADFAQPWTFEELCPLGNSDDHEVIYIRGPIFFNSKNKFKRIFQHSFIYFFFHTYLLID